MIWYVFLMLSTCFGLGIGRFADIVDILIHFYSPVSINPVISIWPWDYSVSAQTPVQMGLTGVGQRCFIIWVCLTLCFPLSWSRSNNNLCFFFFHLFYLEVDDILHEFSTVDDWFSLWAAVYLLVPYLIMLQRSFNLWNTMNTICYLSWQQKCRSNRRIETDRALLGGAVTLWMNQSRALDRPVGSLGRSIN